MVCFNGNYVAIASINPVLDRAFAYADGLFETIKVSNAKVSHFHLHVARLVKGMQVLRLKGEASFLEHLELNILKTCELNQLTDARVKLTLWRKPGGLYIPTTDDINYMITAQNLSIEPSMIKSLGICSSVALNSSIYSELKTLNALPYVLAGLEKKASGFDELILLDTFGNIAECTSSNLFWKKGTEIFTPSLKTGCIAGIGRRIEIDYYLAKGIIVNEGEFIPKELNDAEEIWITNALNKKKVQLPIQNL
jgi:4-amino-4-deoxychorismate lyase